MKKIWAFLKLVISYLNGNFAYQNYLKIHNQNHPEIVPMNQKNFFRERTKNKKINRCC